MCPLSQEQTNIAVTSAVVVVTVALAVATARVVSLWRRLCRRAYLLGPWIAFFLAVTTAFLVSSSHYILEVLHFLYQNIFMSLLNLARQVSMAIVTMTIKGQGQGRYLHVLLPILRKINYYTLVGFAFTVITHGLLALI